MGKIKRNEFKQGYVINKLKHSSTKKDTPINFADLVYPNGIIPFVILIILYIIGLIVVLTVAHFKDVFFHLRWHNYCLAVSGVTVCLNLLWWLGRTGIFNGFGYMGLKFSRLVKWYNFKEKIHITSINAALKEINTYHEFNEYVTFRQKHTKKWMYISCILHGSIFIISLIIFLIAEFVII